MRMHSWKSMHSISPVAIKKCGIDWRSMVNQEICDSTPLQLDFWEIYVIACLHLFWLLKSSVTAVGWGIKIQMHAQFREENGLVITLAKSTICAGNKIFIIFFSFALKREKSSKSSSPQDSPSKCTRTGLNLIFGTQTFLSSDRVTFWVRLSPINVGYSPAVHRGAVCFLHAFNRTGPWLTPSLL